jgi:hypothetical protein
MVVIAANASGIMSPRVVFALLFQAKISHDTLADDLENDGKPLVKMNDYCLKICDPALGLASFGEICKVIQKMACLQPGFC